MKYVKKIGIPTFTFILGLVIAGSIGVTVAVNIESSTVDYNKNSQATVEDALDDLYTKAADAGLIPYTGDNLALHIKDLHSYDGDGSNLYYHDNTGNSGSYTGAEYEAGDLSYRFSGPSANVANYVCFASDEATCPSENLYRIIGIFKDTNNDYQVKLIKSTAGQSTVNGATMLGTNGAYSSSTAYYWTSSSNSSNAWSGSALNTVNLNTNYVAYLNAINSKWMNMIETHTWKVAGNTTSYITGAVGANLYYRELTSPVDNTTYRDEIGLMYVSDYMYGASPSYWNLSVSSYDSAKTSNWLALGSQEWTITRNSGYSDYAFYIQPAGNMYYTLVTRYEVVRPTFYLKSNVIYYDGSGTSGDPYRIALSE